MSVKPPGRWLWPLPVPRALGEAAWQAALSPSLLLSGRRWIAVGAAAGAVPLLLGAALGLSWHQPLSAALVAMLLLGALRADDQRRGLGVLAVAFAAHSLVAIALAYHAPDRAAACLPGGSAYWAKNLHWIKTGEDPEYIVANWLPAHFQLLGAMILLTYMSLGFVPLIQGFHEVDLMNYYVGRLLAGSDGSPVSLLLGWHPWSVLRGVCYALVAYEVASWSLERLTGRPLSPPARRWARMGAAGAFFALDCVVKYFSVEAVRGALSSHFIG